MKNDDTLGHFVTKAYGATGSFISGEKLKEMEVERQKPQGDEVLIEVLYCGVCHSDIHQVENDWKNTIYPCVPGHEIVGRVTELGARVSNFTVGQLVGVGCMIDSCQQCKSCTSGEEQLCTGPVRMTMTYNGYFDPDGSGYNTFGGYSTHVVSNEKFVFAIPDSLPMAAAAPILCAGVTTYAPLKDRGVTSGDKVGVIGIGGLGHMGVMIAKAMGAEVTAITTNKDKIEAALELGANSVLISEDKKAMQEAEATFDFLLCTIPDQFDINPYINLLAPRGSIVTVGLLGPYEKPINNMELAKFNRSAGASIIGSVADTKEVLEFCAKHQIIPQTEIITIDQVNDAFKKIKEEDVRFRYVIDMSSLK
ncbi:MAG: NAD(P)-dependent alcohol dehydrogenase [Flavobacterium sp.]|nr:NAD(P)-dependent alcohol dehydrogenase [Flavobacterium sp.]